MKKNLIFTSLLVSLTLSTFGGTTIIYPATQTHYVPQQTTVVIQQPAISTQTIVVEQPTTTEVVVENIAPIIHAITPLVTHRPPPPKIKHHCRPIPLRPTGNWHRPPPPRHHSPKPMPPRR